MRFLIRAQLPTEAGNKMMENNKIVNDIEAYMASVNSKNAFFLEANGERTMLFVVNMERVDQMPLIAEPLFKMGAKVEFHPAMVLDDLKKMASGKEPVPRKGKKATAI